MRYVRTAILLKHLPLVIVLALSVVPAVSAAESKLLESVKDNPQEAKSLCGKFRKMNTKGKSAYNKKTTKTLANSKQLSISDAEVLVTYVVAMHCPDVR